MYFFPPCLFFLYVSGGLFSIEFFLIYYLSQWYLHKVRKTQSLLYVCWDSRLNKVKSFPSYGLLYMTVYKKFLTILTGLQHFEVIKIDLPFIS